MRVAICSYVCCFLNSSERRFPRYSAVLSVYPADSVLYLAALASRMLTVLHLSQCLFRCRGSAWRDLLPVDSSAILSVDYAVHQQTVFRISHHIVILSLLNMGTLLSSLHMLVYGDWASHWLYSKSRVHQELQSMAGLVCSAPNLCLGSTNSSQAQHICIRLKARVGSFGA